MYFDFLLFFIKAAALIIPFLWQNMLYAGIVFMLAWLVITIFKIKSPRWQYALWLLVLVRLVLPPDFSHPFSSRNLLTKLPMYERFIHLFDYLKADLNPTTDESNGIHGISIDNPSIYARGDSKAWTINRSQKTRLVTGLFLAWLAGMSIFLVLYLKKLARFHRVIKRAKLVDDQKFLKIVRVWCSQFQVRQIVRIVSSDEYLSPFTIGIFKPIICLPQKALEIENNEQLESILAHEICHIRRYDNLWIKAQSLLQIIYFFNPVVWYVNSKISLSRECICDSMVLSMSKISATSYGNGIMTVLKLNLFGADEIDVLPGFGSQRKKLIYRINNLKGEKMKGKYQSLLIFGTLLSLGIFLLPMAENALDDRGNQSITNTQLIAAENYITVNDAIPVKKEDIDFTLPVKIGKISARFGKMRDPYKQKIVHHNGIDIAAPKGTEVYAAADGKVEIATDDKKRGKHILLLHEDGYQTFYSHCDSLLFQKGQHVKSGEVIAYVGETGRATGPHLHFEIRKDGTAQDPQKYIDFDNLKKVK